MSVKLGNFNTVKVIGKGTFGEVYTAKSITDFKIYAAKIERKNSQNKTIKFESKILRVLQRIPYAPRFVEAGISDQGAYIVMELVGPSLISVLKDLKRTKFSISTGLRLSYHTLKAVEAIHNCCILHRDLKPSNILLRDNKEYPIAIIDYGLSRIYVDTKTGKLAAPRNHPGFRGTTTYASINAHNMIELARRDDVISWYYIAADLITGTLPWKKADSPEDILYTKKHFDISSIFNSSVPELSEMWKDISALRYEDKPNYQALYECMESAMKRLHISLNDPYDWDGVIDIKHYYHKE